MTQAVSSNRLGSSTTPSIAAAPAARAELWDLLGGLRFLLAMIVLAKHIEWFSGKCWVVQRLISLGAFPAVLCFLVISGYSIGHSIARRPAGFLGRRFLRIYPLYALAVVAAIPSDVINGIVVPASFTGVIHSQWAHNVAGNLLFTQTFHYLPIASNPVLWSLAVEAAFYLMTPILVRLATPHLFALAGLSAVAFVAFPKTGLGYYAWLRHGLPVLFLGWAWLAGFIYHRVRADGRAGIGLIVAVLGLTTLNHTYMEDRANLLLLLTLCILVFGGGAKLPAIVRRPLAFCGDLSYPLYLFHAPLLLIYAKHFGGQSQWLLGAMAVALSAVMLAVDAALRPVAAAAWDVAAAAAADGSRSVRNGAVAAARVVVRVAAPPASGLRGLTAGLASPAINISIAAGVALVAVLSTVVRR